MRGSGRGIGWTGRLSTLAPTIEDAPPAPLIGMSDAEAADRRARGQGNNVHFAPSRSYGEIVRDNALTPINILLMATGTLLISLQLFRDAAVTVGLVALNVGITIVQEFRSKRALDRIALLTRPKATVIRDGQERTIDPAELVVGDLIVARPGDQIVVDGRMVRGSEAEMDESLLTGESTGVPKETGDPVSSGSFLRTGELVYEAERVGAESRANSLTIEARQFNRIYTPVQRQIALVLRIMILTIFVIGGPVALDLILRVVAWALDPVYGSLATQLKAAYEGYPVEENVRTAAVIISLVPQGLALMLTVAYAMGAVRISRHNALLQRANAVESLSHVEVLCLDKTGTLTTNRLTYHDIWPLQGDRAEMEAALGALAASVTAGNKTVEAISAALSGEKATVSDEVPFSSRWKWSGARIERNGRREWLIMGAPEVLERVMPHDIPAAQRIDEWTSQGLRVLLLACADGGVEIRRQDRVPELPVGLEAVGLVALRDELQPNVQETIDHFEEANVELKIISGDHPETVAALARQAGVDIHQEHGLYSGMDLTRMNDREFAEAALLGTVFGRITPEQKVGLIEALQKAGKYVAMIGDGVNDVLALKRAEVGIAMEHGSQATRAVSDLVLLGDSFAALPPAFREGQRIVRGAQDLIKLFVSRVLAMVVVIVGVGTLGVGFP
ncbi:MAG: HAD-IC family P-type ATPase, partial [Chloroflexota bacterium]|nr:HAD-IC family P-type ATPase [Chloroflexota bacterium]